MWTGKVKLPHKTNSVMMQQQEMKMFEVHLLQIYPLYSIQFSEILLMQKWYLDYRNIHLDKTIN